MDDPGRRRKRRRTGCLSCRARRVKCDERKPTCYRCEAANIECSGYEAKRQVANRATAQTSRQKGLGREQQMSSHASSGDQSLSVRSSTALVVEGSLLRRDHDVAESPHTARHLERAQTIVPVPISIRGDNAPLTALLSNPDSSQRPCSDARGVLAYHQFVFRTLPILFSHEHMRFWRDKLCHEAWGTEYIYLAMTALGSMHRAALLISTPNENDRNRGLDTRVIAFQTYTRALESLSRHINEAKARPDMLVAVLELLAYFEACAINTNSYERLTDTLIH